MPSFLQSGKVARLYAVAAIALVAQVSGSSDALAQTVSLDNVPPITLSTSSTVSAVSIDASTGNVTVRTSSGTYNQCTQPAGPVINSFFPSLSTVTPGSQITLNWSVNSAVTSCTPAPGTGTGTSWASLGTFFPPNNSATFSAPGTSSPTPITFQLNCTNGSTVVSQSTQVTVQNETGGTCTPIYPNGQPASWSGTFAAWPAYGVRRRITNVPANGYYSWSFVATSVANQFGTVTTSEYPFDGDGFGLMSISRTPGCFTASELGANCLGGVQRNSSISWKNGSSSPTQCNLTPGQTYYVNFTYGNASSAGNGPYCTAGAGLCGADVQQIESE